MTALWNEASAPQRAALRAAAERMVEIKLALQEIAEGADAAAHCADCRGACCRTGCYHFSVVDMLLFLALAEPLFEPDFGNGLCPYLDKNRCLMAPALRPFNCITFNCDRIEELLAAETVTRFYQLERQLRRHYREAEALFPGGTAFGTLLDLESP